MSTITSTAAGNWATGGTWIGGVAPGIGDSAVINHAVVVAANVTVGTSDVSGTAAVTVNSPGSLTINDSKTFEYRGDIIQNNAPITIGAGCTVTHNSSNASTPASTQYKWQIGTAHNQANAAVTVNGTALAPSLIKSNTAASAKNGYITDGAFLRGAKLNLTQCDFTDFGDASTPFITFALTTAADTVQMQNCILTRCSNLNSTYNIADATTFNITNVTWKSTSSTLCFTLNMANARTSGVRQITGCVFDKGWTCFPPKGLTFTNNYCDAQFTITDAQWDLFSGNFMRMDGSDQVVAGNTNGNFWYVDNTSKVNPHFIQSSVYPRDYTHDGDVFYFNGADWQGDCITLGSPSAPVNVLMQNLLTLPNSSGDDSGTLFTALGSANVTFQAIHNTYFIGRQGAAIAETYAGRAGMCTKFASNLAWDNSVRSYKLYRSGTSIPADYVTAVNCDYNGGFNFLAGSNSKGYNNLSFSSGTPGAHDVTADPQFNNKAASLISWDTSLSGAGTEANVQAELKKKNDRSGYNSSYSIAAWITYVKTAFQPKNQAYKSTGHDGGDIGSQAVVAGGTTPSGGFGTALPLKATWESNMTEFGGYLATYFADALQQRTATGTNENGQSAYYYDMLRNFYQIKDYTNDAATWNPAAVNVRAPYRDYYVIPNNGGAAGFWVFSEGLVQDYLRTANATSKTAAQLLIQNAAFAQSNTFNDANMPDQAYSRETAYALESQCNASLVGLTTNTARIQQLVGFALGHIDQWAISKTATYLRPFMAALTTEALIKYVTTFSVVGTERANIVNRISTLWTLIWNTLWVSGAGAFRYTDRIVDASTDMDPVPDLNLLCIQPFGWLYYMTADTGWIAKGDQVFQGGVSIYTGQNWVSGAYLGQRTAFGSNTDNSVSGVNGKHFNQNYRLSFEYVRLRELTPIGVITPPPPPPPPPPIDPGPSPQPTPGVAIRVPHGSFTYREDGSIMIIAENNQDLFLGTSGTGAVKIMVNGQVVHTILSGSSQLGDLSIQSGNLIAATPGKGVQIKEGSNSRMGVATLVAGTVTVANTSVTAKTRILLSNEGAAGTLGILSSVASVGVGFVVNSSSASDTSQVLWMLVEAL